jgi:hypothetical protein
MKGVKEMKRTSQKILILSLMFCVLSVETAAQTCAPAPAGLVGWWRGENNANDSSGNGHNGSLNTAGSFTGGKVGQAFNFTEQNQSILLPNNSALFPPNALTIEAWINPANYTNCVGEYRVFHTVQNLVAGYQTAITCSDQRLFGAIYNSSGNGNSVSSNTAIPAGAFTHFAVTWDGSNLRMYINGVLENTVATTITTVGSHSENPRIGNDINFGFRGQVDEVSLYNRALSATEVSAIFNAGTAGKCVTTTAASVSVAGRVTTAGGRGIAKARVSLTDANGETRTALTNSFGYFRFAGVSAGETYVFSVSAKRYTFNSPAQARQILEDTDDINFAANN